MLVGHSRLPCVWWMNGMAEEKGWLLVRESDGIRERRQTGAITPPDIPEIGVKPNKLKCAHSSSSFHQTCDGDRIPFLYLNDANASQSGEKKSSTLPPDE